MNIRVAMPAIAAVLLAACSVPEQPVTSAFSPELAAGCMGGGDATLEGQAFLRTVGGEVRYAAGSEVILIPENSYSTEVLTLVRRGIQPTGIDPRYNETFNITVADGEGEFTFEGVKPCPYVVVTSVFWGVPSGYVTYTQGGYLYQRVTLEPGKKKRVIMNTLN